MWEHDRREENYVAISLNRHIAKMGCYLDARIYNSVRLTAIFLAYHRDHIGGGVPILSGLFEVT